MKKVISLSEARKTFLSTWDVQRLDLIEKTFNEVKEFLLCEMKIQISIYENNSPELHDLKIVLQNTPMEVNLYFSTQFKKYFVHADFSALKNITKYCIDDAKKGLTEPVQIGKLSTKKLTDWIDFYNEMYKKLVVENEANGNKKDEFLKSIEGLPVVWNSDNKSGYIVQGGLEMTFQISETYVSKKIGVHYKTSNDVETFLKMSNNKL